MSVDSIAVSFEWTVSVQIEFNRLISLAEPAFSHRLLSARVTIITTVARIDCNGTFRSLTQPIQPDPWNSVAHRPYPTISSQSK